MRRGKPALPVTAAVLLAVSLAVGGCKKQHAAAPTVPAVPVTTAAAVQQDIPVAVQVIGTAEPYATVTIKSRVAGQLVKVGFVQGQEVKKGDLLFEVDRRPFTAALAAAKANLARDIATAKNAREEAEFQGDIFKRSAGTQRELDKAAAAAEAADAQVDADKAAVQNAEIQLGYCTILSPVDGRTGDLMTYEGSIVKNDDTSLVVINQVHPIYVAFSVAEKYLPRIRQYMASSDTPLTVDVSIPQTSVQDERGELSFVDNQVDRTTGMIQLKGTFPNDNRKLWPGQFVNVSLVLTSLKNVMVVPTEAVQTGQQGQFVFTVNDDMTVESHPVTTGVTWKNFTVIDKGVLANQTVVTDGQLRLIPGSRISIKNASESRPAQTQATAKAE
jgi:membrane fusion protein, multidrug efflux system